MSEQRNGDWPFVALVLGILALLVVAGIWAPKVAGGLLALIVIIAAIFFL